MYERNIENLDLELKVYFFFADLNNWISNRVKRLSMHTHHLINLKKYNNLYAQLIGKVGT